MQNRTEVVSIHDLHMKDFSWKIPANSNGAVTVTIKDKKLFVTFHVKDPADLAQP